VWPEYLKRLQASWDGDGERTAAIEEELASGRLVVLDDVDKRNPSQWSREVLFTAMNRRYNEGLPTVMTFNHGPDDADPKAPGRKALEEFLGRATLDRLIGSVAKVVAFEGASYRSGRRLGVR
jgi:DNA replication protein DnaC